MIGMRIGFVVALLVGLAFAGCVAPGGSGGSGSCVLVPVTGPAGPATGPDAPNATLLITRDFGTASLRTVTDAAAEADTVMDFLMRHADVEAAYGGGFVAAIDGLRSGHPDSQMDWFYEVDGEFASVGAADWMLQGGERIHWDYRPWTGDREPGLFNSFPWHETAVYVDDVDPHLVPQALADRAQAWGGAWPEGPAVLVATPATAPWDDVPRFELRPDGQLEICGTTHEAGGWAFAARAVPPHTQRALLVVDGVSPVLPSTAPAWVTAGQDVAEVRPA